jgi:hypothetical protein
MADDQSADDEQDPHASMELEVPLAESGGKLQRREPEEERAGQNVNERQGRMPGEPSIQTGTDTSVAGETDLDTGMEVPIFTTGYSEDHWGIPLRPCGEDVVWHHLKL